MEKCGVAREAARQCGGALHAGLLRLHARKHTTATLHLPPSHTHTHTHKYVVLIAFAHQQWFRERFSVLRCTYIGCLVCWTLCGTEMCFDSNSYAFRARLMQRTESLPTHEGPKSSSLSLSLHRLSIYDSCDI